MKNQTSNSVSTNAPSTLSTLLTPGVHPMKSNAELRNKHPTDLEIAHIASMILKGVPTWVGYGDRLGQCGAALDCDAAVSWAKQM